MPKENIKILQRQERLFEDRLSVKLNKENKLYKLRDMVDWSALEVQALPSNDIKRFGRNQKDHNPLISAVGLNLRRIANVLNYAPV